LFFGGFFFFFFFFFFFLYFFFFFFYKLNHDCGKRACHVIIQANMNGDCIMLMFLAIKLIFLVLCNEPYLG
jgi:hypothetical protein